ncbi:MAG TPA: NYN domain-containing protein [Vicinamibacterales bacterium]|nr:NYN domain-containing protein [Vicinamibacterales bacterium]
MAFQQERLNIAVFIDFDNIEIGVKNTLRQSFDVGTVLEAIKERGEIVSKIAYADWTRAGDYSRHLTQHAVRLVQRNLTPGGDKNGADINMALDALEMAFTHQHINAYVIVGGDSDFLSLVEKLKQYDKKVFIVGGRAFTSGILQKNCHEFIAYENLSGVRRAAARDTRSAQPPSSLAAQPIAQAFPLVKRALKVLAEREVSPQTGLLKSTLLQLDSTFSERNYGSSSFLDFAEKLSQAGLVTLKTSGRSVMVELNPDFVETESVADVVQVFRPADAEPPERSNVVQAFPPAPETSAGNQADAVRLVGDALRNAAAARWPMYVRNVKQIIRAADANFDERKYGFGGLMDLLRACQRDALIRMERDRRGGLRVFPGVALQRAAIANEPQVDVAQDEQIIDTAPGEPTYETPLIPVEAEPIIDGDAQPVDTTAELLGRAKARRPRVRPAPPSGGKKKRAAAAKRPSRSKKSAPADDDNFGNQ